MVEEKVYCGYEGERSQRQEHLGESRGKGEGKGEEKGQGQEKRGNGFFHGADLPPYVWSGVKKLKNIIY